MRRGAGELGDVFLLSLIRGGEEEEAHYLLIQRSLYQNWHEGSHHQLGSVGKEGGGRRGRREEEEGEGGRRRKRKEGGGGRGRREEEEGEGGRRRKGE